MDFTVIRNCINPEFLGLFAHLSIIDNNNYHYKIIHGHGKIEIHIEKMGENKQFLLEYQYKLHYYRLFCCSKYRNERVILYSQKPTLEQEVYFCQKIFSEAYRNSKLIRYEDFLMNGYFLLNKLVNAYHNPNKGLCQMVLEKHYNETLQQID